MKVAVYYKNDDIRIEEREKPTIKSGEILVKVHASGICGTDIMEWYRIKKAPRVLGHEMTGEIFESKSDLFSAGQRVFVSHHVPCNNCKYCLSGNHTACETLHTGNYDPGGFSEYVRVPEINVTNGTYVLPKHISYEEGTMIEPLACVVRGHQVADIKKGHTVLVMGAGVSGLLNILHAKLLKATVIVTDVDDTRLQLAKITGADQVINTNETIDFKADKIIMCTGAMGAFERSFKILDRKGVILLFSIPNKNISLPVVDFWRNEFSIISSYGAGPKDLKQSLELLSSQRISIKDIITHRFSLDDIQQGFRVAQQGGEALKVVINP